MKMTVEEIARVAYEVNAAYCRALGDDSFHTWEEAWGDAEQWQKDTVTDGVQFHIDNPCALPSAGHENWLSKKEEDGWSYGEVEDFLKKEHPCMLPFEDLPTVQQAKDYIFAQVVRSLAQ